MLRVTASALLSVSLPQFVRELRPYLKSIRAPFSSTMKLTGRACALRSERQRRSVCFGTQRPPCVLQSVPYSATAGGVAPRAERHGVTKRVQTAAEAGCHVVQERFYLLLRFHKAGEDRNPPPLFQLASEAFFFK